MKGSALSAKSLTVRALSCKTRHPFPTLETRLALRIISFLLSSVWSGSQSAGFQVFGHAGIH